MDEAVSRKTLTQLRVLACLKNPRVPDIVNLFAYWNSSYALVRDEQKFERFLNSNSQFVVCQ